MTDAKIVDVIITTYNGEQFVHEAIESVLQQSYPHINLIIINDCSVDDTQEVLEHYKGKDKRINIISNKSNLGIIKTLNIGLNHSHNDFVSFLDHDDLWHRDKIKTQVDLFASNPNLSASFTLIQEFNDKNLNGPFRARTIPLKGIAKSTVLLRRNVFNQIGLFSEGILSGGDFIQWFLRYKKYNLQYNLIETVLTYRRIHNNNMTRTMDKAAYLGIIKSHLKSK